mgnify:CR=1 FL=1
MSYFSAIFAYARVVSTTVGKSQTVLANLLGFGADDEEGTSASATSSAERFTGEAFATCAGVVCRPRAQVPKRQATGRNPAGVCEVITARRGDGAQCLASRDLRLNARVNPEVGDVALVGYAGGQVVIRDVTDLSGSQLLMLAPRLKSDGTIDKSHAVILDPSAAGESVSIVHMNGCALLMTKAGHVILKNADGSQFIDIGPSELLVNGVLKLLAGVVAGNPETAQTVALAQPVIDFITKAGPMLATLAGAVNGLAPATIPPSDIVQLGLATAPYAAPGALTVQAATLKASAT